jgi:hypothetical protein
MIDSSFEVILCYKAHPGKEINNRRLTTAAANLQEHQTSFPLLTLLPAAPLASQTRSILRTPPCTT